MLDIGLHQGSSLHCHTPEVELRLLAVLSQDGEGPALETLWQVCSHLQRLGYPVIVLDGTAQECDEAPGLQQLLVSAPWGDGALPAADLDASSLAVLPALHGLHALAFNAPPLRQPLQVLQPLFRQYAVVVLYAPVATLASPLMAEAATAPLLVMAPGPAGVVESYKQLKHLAIHTGLAGTVACVVSDDPGQQHQASHGLNALRECAAQHLGQHIGTTAIHAGNAQDLQRLALQLLENAATIGAPAYTATPYSHSPADHSTPFFQSH